MSDIFDYRDFLMVTVESMEDIPAMLVINEASSKWLMGQLDTGTYFDILESFDINPLSHVRPLETLVGV
ncbi:MAG: hypothetical protein HEQ19_13980 [Gloeotrichia echinulata CP02]|jgi:hypothetical protein|nr:hypothetical protein [Gloeotrichia echinulata DEX184]